MRVLDLFAGLGGWGASFREHGHEVYTVDWDSRFNVDLRADISKLVRTDLPWQPDLVLASPPCETFSVASIGTHWAGGKKAYIPRTLAAARSIMLVHHTVNLLESIGSPYIIENPRGVLRNIGLIQQDPVTVWYCHYGEDRAKPTDVWSTLPTWVPRRPCHNRQPSHSIVCCCQDHVAASRGAKTGTQGLSNAPERSLIPYELSDTVRIAAERFLR